MKKILLAVARVWLLVFVSAMITFLPSLALAIPIIEPAAFGSTRGGLSIGDAYIGVRFSLTTKTLITEIGGQVQSWSDDNHPLDWDFDRTVFFALVPLQGDSLFPSDISLSEAIYSEVVDLHWSPGNYAIHNDVLVSVNQILTPGDYGVVFGSGLFGATGSGWMPYTFSSVERDVPDPNYFTYQPHRGENWLELNGTNHTYKPRCVVNGDAIAPVPEPATMLLFGTGLAGLAGSRLRRKKKS